MSSPQPIGVCAILLNPAGEILVGKRKNSYKAGMYGLPGGRVEVGEPLSAAVAREVAEETGLSNLQFQYLGAVRENQGDYDFVHFIFTARVGDHTPALCEPEKCEGWEWWQASADLSQVLAGHRAGIMMHAHQEKIADLT